MYTRMTNNVGKPDNLHALDALTYRNNWTEPVAADKASEVDVTTQYLFFSSADRDVGSDPSPFHFKAKLPTPCKNVVSLRILQMVIPAVADLASQPHIFIDFPEVSILEHTGSGATYTAMATFTPHFGSRGFVNIDQRTLAPVGCVLKPSKPRLDVLTFAVRRADGTLYAPTDAAYQGSILPQHQVSFVIEIMTRVRKNPNHAVLI